MYLFTQLFSDAPLVAQVLGLLQLAFSVWMMVDAYRRHVENFWYWVIFCFQPAGAWVYFFAVKVRTWQAPGMRGAVFTGERRLSLHELRYCVERSPTVANRLALAEGLMEGGQHAEAIPLLHAILAVESDYCRVLHALATCLLATGSPEQALAPLQTIMQRDARWSNYSAWETLICVHLAREQPADALETCRELAKRQPTLKNKCLLAEHLFRNDRSNEAVRVLHEALAEHRFTPWLARWHNRQWARRARRLLAEPEKAWKTTEVDHGKQESPELDAVAVRTRG